MPQRNSTLYLIMINRLSRGWSASDALNLFNSMPCTVRNVVLMIDGLAHNGDNLIALKLFSFLHSSMVTPSGFTVMKSCVELKSIAYSMQIHALKVKPNCGEGEKSDYIYNSLMNMYGKCRDLGQTENIFHRLKKKDLVSFNQIMDGRI
ncbi:Pentatricopeptide repeat-containing protein [Nymphaea thermarum]|nr:Pentatricopeptide repeat-containing protein [Nymphaea thermarum]